jgi:hypothetical protein
MRLLTFASTILLTGAFCLGAVHAQDSPIYLNDNGGVPFETEGQKGKAPGKSKNTQQGTRTKTPGTQETHVHYEGPNGIRQNLDKSYYVQGDTYKAVCLETPDGNKISLADKAPWSLISVSATANLVISSADNTSVRIDPGPHTKPRRTTDLDDDDPKGGTATQLIGAIFRFLDISDWYPYYSAKNQFQIHYCGPKNCLGADGKTDNCANANLIKKK